MAIHRTCDGITRRDVVRIGGLGASALTLSNHLRWTRAAEAAGRSPRATSAIFINLNGGPSHLDTFDLKPDAPAEFRGEFGPISTTVPGLAICEHLPRLAGCMDRFTLLRGVSHSLAAHELGSRYVNTGNRPIPSLDFPGYGAVISREFGGEPDLPAAVSIAKSHQSAGYLGVRYAPFATGSAPKAGQPFAVRGISMADEVTVEDVERRQQLLDRLDQTFRDIEDDSQLMDGLDEFSTQAHTIITSRRTRDAFDISREAPAFATPFGESQFGQSCLLATRLVEAGVRFVTVQFGGWDTHNDNWKKLRDAQLPPLDAGLAALVTGLEQKGLLESTVVFVTGEFGRTPKINQRGGRDHYARAMFMLLAGGGIKPGQVLGATDEHGATPRDTDIAPDDVAASFYSLLGIDHRKEYQTSTGRPVMIVRDGEPIPSLFG